jgi:small subunit ribosomal protein S21e
VDLYIPRKCSWTNRLITATDHASIQINIGHLDEQGIYTNQFTTFALSGFVRSMVRPWQRRSAPRLQGLGLEAAAAVACSLASEAALRSRAGWKLRAALR